MKRYLFFIEQPYCLSILRPLQKEIISRGDNVAWFIAGDKVDPSVLSTSETLLTQVKEVINYDPIAVFVPGNIVPHFFPGIKVQVFHGLEWKKKGHFVIRGFFDLYCTHGKITTEKFSALSQSYNNYFYTIQTGWPKLDAFLPAKITSKGNKPKILYAPTFSPKLTSAYDLFKPLIKLSKQGNYQIIIKFHPLMGKAWVDKFIQEQNINLTVSNDNDLLRVLEGCDVVLSDTSSAVTEALLLGKKVVTYKNSLPQNCLINFDTPDELEEKISQGLSHNNDIEANIEQYLEDVHPYTDGKSSARVLDAVDYVANKGVKKKPLNIFRKFKIRKKLGYFKR